MSVTLRVGIFAVATILAIFIIAAVLGNFSLRHNAYQIGIHFRNVVGLQEGSSVQLAGVEIGLVDQIQLLPDQTASVICSINNKNTVYRGSTFTVTTTLTGSSTLAIFPPRNVATAVPLPRYVLPEHEQPEGLVPLTIADLVQQGQTQLRTLSKTLNIVNKELPGLVGHFNRVAVKTELLVTHADKNFTGLGQRLTATVASVDSLVGSVQLLVASNGRNISDLTGTLRELVAANGPKVQRLIDGLSVASDNLNKTMAAVTSIATDPSVKANLLQATANLKDSSEKLKAIATDIENVTGDPQVQTQLKGTVRNLSEAIEKANMLLGSASPTQRQPQESASPGSEPAPGPSQSPGPTLRRRGPISFDLADTHLRETWDSGKAGPASELNIELLPHFPSHVTFGAYDIGYNTSYNFLLDFRGAPNWQYAFGVYHSYLGATTTYRPFGPLGIDLRVYDPKRPKLDLYGDIQLARRLELFYGERSLLGPIDLRKPQFGFQINY